MIGLIAALLLQTTVTTQGTTVVGRGGTTSGTKTIFAGPLNLTNGTATLVLPGTYATRPVCTANDTSALANVQPTYTVSNGQWTVTFRGSGNDNFDAKCEVAQ